MTSFFFLIKKYYFDRLLKSRSLSFMTRVNPNNGNETESDIFPWDIFKSDAISFFIKEY